MRNFFRKLFSPIIWGNMLAILVLAVAAVFGAKLWLDEYTHHGKSIEVPDVTGKTPLEASGTLRMYGLRTEVADSSYSSQLPPGIILSQKPSAGSKVKQGREIQLTINSHSAPTIALPEIAGNSSVREAQDRLLELGFQIGPTEYVDGDAGWVYSMKCNGRDVSNGEQVPIGATIVLQVGGRMEADSLEDELINTEPKSEETVYDYD